MCMCRGYATAPVDLQLACQFAVSPFAVSTLTIDLHFPIDLQVACWSAVFLLTCRLVAFTLPWGFPRGFPVDLYLPIDLHFSHWPIFFPLTQGSPVDPDSQSNVPNTFNLFPVDSQFICNFSVFCSLLFPFILFALDMQLRFTQPVAYLWIYYG